MIILVFYNLINFTDEVNSVIGENKNQSHKGVQTNEIFGKKLIEQKTLDNYEKSTKVKGIATSPTYDSYYKDQICLCRGSTQFTDNNVTRDRNHAMYTRNVYKVSLNLFVQVRKVINKFQIVP